MPKAPLPPKKKKKNSFWADSGRTFCKSAVAKVDAVSKSTMRSADRGAFRLPAPRGLKLEHIPKVERKKQSNNDCIMVVVDLSEELGEAPRFAFNHRILKYFFLFYF